MYLFIRMDSSENNWRIWLNKILSIRIHLVVCWCNLRNTNRNTNETITQINRRPFNKYQTISAGRYRTSLSIFQSTKVLFAYTEFDSAKLHCIDFGLYLHWIEAEFVRPVRFRLYITILNSYLTDVCNQKRYEFVWKSQRMQFLLYNIIPIPRFIIDTGFMLLYKISQRVSPSANISLCTVPNHQKTRMDRINVLFTRSIWHHPLYAHRIARPMCGMPLG